MKFCPLCNTSKPLADFYLRKSAKDGRHSYCIVCSKIENRKRYLNNLKLRLANAAKYRAENAEKLQNYRNGHRDKMAQVNKEYHAKNKATLNADNRRRAAADREGRKKASREWAQANPHLVRQQAAKRRAVSRQATPKWANRFFVQEAYHLATLRTRVTGIEWHVDHVVPLNSPLVCGLHCEANLAVIPATENLSKSNRQWPDMPT